MKKIIKTKHQRLKKSVLGCNVGWIEDLIICLRKLGSQEHQQ